MNFSVPICDSRQQCCFGLFFNSCVIISFHINTHSPQMNPGHLTHTETTCKFDIHIAFLIADFFEISSCKECPLSVLFQLNGIVNLLPFSPLPLLVSNVVIGTENVVTHALPNLSEEKKEEEKRGGKVGKFAFFLWTS